MPQVGFVPTISAGERSQTHALDREANGTGKVRIPSDICSKYVLPILERSTNPWNLAYSRDELWDVTTFWPLGMYYVL